MKLFERETHSSRSKMNPIEIGDVIEDIKFSSLGSKQAEDLAKDGYLPFVRFENNFEGDMHYFIKPTKEVSDYMVNTGYGKPSGVEYSDITNAISFHALWKSSSISMNTTPQIAGVLDNDDLQKTLGELKYDGACQVNKAYLKMYTCEPNYALNSINITGNTLTKMQTLSRKMWLAAGFMLNDNEIVQKAHNGDYDMAFKDHDKMKFLDDNFNFEKPFYVPKNKNKSSLKL